MERDELERVDGEVEEAEARMARDVADLEQRTERLGERVEATRRDWERKREDPHVPGAPPPEERPRRARFRQQEIVLRVLRERRDRTPRSGAAQIPRRRRAAAS